jgi:hypothetical protein
MREQVVPSAVVIHAEILVRLRAQFGDERLSRTQAYDCSKSFKDGRTEAVTGEDYTLCRKSYGQRFRDSQGVSFIDFLIE